MNKLEEWLEGWWYRWGEIVTFVAGTLLFLLVMVLLLAVLEYGSYSSYLQECQDLGRTLAECKLRYRELIMSSSTVIY